MADLTEKQAALPSKLMGSDINGDETTPIGSTTLLEMTVADVPNQVGLSIVLNLTTSVIEGKVGASTMTNRKYIEMQALTTSVKWGYSISSQPFDLFKNQFFSLPMGTNCKIYFKANVGTAQVAIAEK